jgi:hypothetical protein
MLVSNGITQHRYSPTDPRLGRHMELDGRSLAYLVLGEPELAKVTIKPAAYETPIPILDQGNLGSCTGNAGTAGVAAAWAQAGRDWQSISLNGLELSGDGNGDEQFAVELYHEATIKDGFEGEYPPDDSGSSGLGVCRALKAAGLIHSYTWATSLHALGLAFQRGGVIVGMPWLNAFFSPDADGFIDHDPAWQASGVAGGHELYWAALEAYDPNNPHNTIFRFDQSWGQSWGDHGRGRIRGSTYQALRQQIDAKQFKL